MHGKLKDDVVGWKSLTSYPVLEDAIKHYHIEFGDVLPFHAPSRAKQINFSLSEREMINEEITKILNKGVVGQTLCVEGEFTTNRPSLCVPRKMALKERNFI